MDADELCELVRQFRQTLEDVKASAKRNLVVGEAAGFLEAFTGESVKSNGEAWLRRLERVATLRKWDNDARLLAVEIKLKGMAADWHAADGAKCRKFADWKEAFKKAFVRSKPDKHCCSEKSVQLVHDENDVSMSVVPQHHE